MTTTVMPPMRIDVNLAEWPQSSTSPTEEKIQTIKERLSTTPTKDPEVYAQRSAHTALLQKLELEAKQARAKRASDLVKENRARKLRMEAAVVARAASKIAKATRIESTRRQEHEAKREAATARRAALFEAVRVAREDRQVIREARQAELAKLEANACNMREKKLQSTVSRSSAQVKHALQVVASLKEKEKEAAAAAATRLADRLSAASDRRQEVLAATAEGAASVGLAAEKVRLRHLYDEKAATEERRHRLTRAMEKAIGRREAAVESIKVSAAAENARVADVVADKALDVSTLKPATMRHALAARLQAAEVRRLELLKKPKVALTSSRPSSRSPSREVSRDVSPRSTPQTSPSKEAAPQAPWSATAGMTTPVKMHKPEPVIVISTEPFHYGAKPPSSRLMCRLLFRPRMLLATAAARHASADGRRQTRLNLDRARANHFGTVRVAVVRGRRAAFSEFSRAIFEMRGQKAAMRAAAHLCAKKNVAAKFNERVTAAKVKRSSLRLLILNAAISKETSRIEAEGRRTAKLALPKYWHAKAFAVKVRRAAADERLTRRGAELAKASTEATKRRNLLLCAIVARARRTTIARARRAEAAKEDAKMNAKSTVAEVKEAAVEVKQSAAIERGLIKLPSFIESAHTSKVEYEEWVKVSTAVLKAAEVSSSAAAQAEARAEARKAAKANANAVKAALEDAAAMAGLQGREAKKAAVATADAQRGASSSAASSVASSDTEEWQVVGPSKM